VKKEKKKVESGKWKVESGKWKVESGDLPMLSNVQKAKPNKASLACNLTL